MQNIGTLVSSSIRPNDSLDPIASAYASEIRGGLHTVTTSTDRDNIMLVRREWGMMCYVINDDKLYQLKYGYFDTTISNNLNWVEFTGSGGGGGGEWVDSVISKLSTAPGSPSDGDRYLITSPSLPPWAGEDDKIGQWDNTLSSWIYTTPTDGMSVRVDNEDNSIYKYEGIYPSGLWDKESLNQVRFISATSSDNIHYNATSDPAFITYQDILFVTKFPVPNTGSSASLNINGIGDKIIKKPVGSGFVDLSPNDIAVGHIYNLLYDGTYFQINISGTASLNTGNKYVIESTDNITVPLYTQYWIYGDLTVYGQLTNYGEVVIADGGLVMSGGTFSNFGSLVFVNVDPIYLNTSTIAVNFAGSTWSADVIPGSLTPSHINSIGGATAGYVLSSNGGIFQWIDPSVTTNKSKETVSDKSLISIATIGDGQFTGATISNTPIDDCYVAVYINGQEFDVGNGSTNSTSCYFSGDGGINARGFSSFHVNGQVQSGDGLYWNETFAEIGLENGWRISLHYLV